MLLIVLAACTGSDGSFEYLLDDTLQFQHLQAKGTHNSYHVETTEIDEWHYTHLPLDEQLGRQGVRQFELDINFDSENERYLVYHVPFLDEGTNCETLVDCLQAQKDWSDRNENHHPILTLLEPKDPFEASTGAQMLAVLEEEVLSVWPKERLVTPDLVRGDAVDLRQAMADVGWPTLGELRGRHLIVLHDGGSWVSNYLNGESTAGLAMFPDGGGDIDLLWAAVHTMNDPYDPDIATVVGARHLVRTRADSNVEEGRQNDTSRREAAFASGAHFISTDFPEPVDWTEYWVDIPHGSPSRCNPLTGPEECTSQDIENPGTLGLPWT
ncbi:MAG: hypothetical protein HN348_16320 [Proteobacteria bacterium]|nr:hypothetical protein [Pseudomonadota bacterium]